MIKIEKKAFEEVTITEVNGNDLHPRKAREAKIIMSNGSLISCKYTLSNAKDYSIEDWEFLNIVSNKILELCDIETTNLFVDADCNCNADEICRICKRGQA